MIRWIAAVIDMKRDVEKSHVSAYAAQAAYFIMLSFFPWAIMLITLINFTDIGKEEV